MFAIKMESTLVAGGLALSLAGFGVFAAWRLPTKGATGTGFPVRGVPRLFGQSGDRLSTPRRVPAQPRLTAAIRAWPTLPRRARIRAITPPSLRPRKR